MHASRHLSHSAWAISFSVHINKLSIYSRPQKVNTYHSIQRNTTSAVNTSTYVAQTQVFYRDLIRPGAKAEVIYLCIPVQFQKGWFFMLPTSWCIHFIMNAIDSGLNGELLAITNNKCDVFSNCLQKYLYGRLNQAIDHNRHWYMSSLASNISKTRH